ncbi:hypothetical protein ACH5RR_018052 [Cinchona calisaya]|uniref:DUF659 domain-containing protein n=1 Tax=Cinchona calisaya TaxID=153742 RepID=A0ABD2ZQE7_9GENT
MKQHLTGENSSVASCMKVALDVRQVILESLNEIALKAKEKRGDFGEENPFGCFVNEYDGDEVQEIPHLQAKRVSFNEVEASVGKGKRKAATVSSPFYQRAIDHIATIEHGYKGPSYYAIWVPLFQDAKKEQSASNIETNAQNLCNLFAVIVGPKNMVHIVTDNPSNCKAAGGLLVEKYPTICWSACAAHCIKLILKDIGEMHEVKALVTLTSTMTIFVYNHRFTLNWLRKSNVEEAPNKELDYEESEAEHKELSVDVVVECSNSQKLELDEEHDDKIGEYVDLELFQHRGFGLIDEDEEQLN